MTEAEIRRKLAKVIVEIQEIRSDQNRYPPGAAWVSGLLDGWISRQAKAKRALGKLKPEPGEHYWLSPEEVKALWPSLQTHGYTSCLWCGLCRRRDGKNKPCRGKVEVNPR